MNLNKTVLFFLLTMFPFMLLAQENLSGTDTLSWVFRSPRLDMVVNKLKEINARKQTMPGYRIQVYSGTQRNQANELRASFNSHFPEIPAAVSYDQPNFKVRAGDFSTRLEAQKYLAEVEKNFSGAFIIPDEIRLPPVN
ncbi:MAG: SPOR domain-containing protein [Bacteroidia bacterium]|nr:SPOR domain-containing protein [Bacteroidia bacterium]